MHSHTDPTHTHIQIYASVAEEETVVLRIIRASRVIRLLGLLSSRTTKLVASSDYSG